MSSRVRSSLGIAGLTLSLLAAAPAGAGDEFEGGFKDELGRIAAHEAVRTGRHLLANILLGAAPVAVAAPVYYPAPAAYVPAPVYYEPEPIYGRTVYHRHDHYYHHPVAYGYSHHGWGHGHGHHRRHHHDCDD